MQAPEGVADLRVVVAHDYLTQRGGAERVVLAIMEAFPDARLLTSVYDPERTFEEFRQFTVETMWPDRVTFLRRDPRRALPFLAHAFSTHPVEQADVIISSTSGWAHGVRSDLPNVVYCHNPARWLYQTEDYFGGAWRRAGQVFGRLAAPLREWDRSSANDSAVYFANSEAVRARVARAYGIDAALLTPPVGLQPDGPRAALDDILPGFLLTVSRGRSYKNASLVCHAVAALPDTRLVVVGPLPARPDGRAWPSNIRSVRDVSDAQMRWLYASCRGTVSVAHEDFGLTPVEGFAFGRPAALLRAGGYLDSAAPGVASVWIEEATLGATVAGLRALIGTSWDEEVIRQHAAQFSRTAFQTRLQEAVLSVVREPRRPRLVSGSGPNVGRRARDAA